MQFRWDVRKTVALPIMVYYDINKPVYVKTRDISLGGMFVETDTTLLDINKPVEVLFNSHAIGNTELQRIQALVVRITREGAGLMFRGYDNNGLLFLQKILHQRERRRSQRGLTRIA